MQRDVKSLIRSPKGGRLSKVILLTLLVVIVAIFFTGCSTDISNSGFSNAGSKRKIFGWTKYNYNAEYKSDYDCTVFTVTKDDWKGNALRIESKENNDARVFQTVHVKPSKIYKISAMIKTEDVENGAGANISAYDCNGKSSGVFGTSDGWIEHTVYLTTAKDQKALKLSFGLGGFGSMSKGVAYFDDVKIERVSEIPEGAESVEFEPKNDDSKDQSVGIVFKLLFAAVIISLLVYAFFLALRSDKEKAKQGLSLSEELPKRNKYDLILITVLTVTCAVMSFVNLGSFKCASSYWKPANADEEIIVTFDGEYTVNCIAFSGGIPSGSGGYKVYYETSEGEWEEVYNILASDIEFYKWDYSEDVEFTASKVKVVATSAGAWLNEMAFFYNKTFENSARVEKSLVPISKSNFEATYENTKLSGRAENLFDEQETVPDYMTYMNGTYFDEIYFPRTAYEHLNGLSIYEKTHPPMGKVFMSLGIKIFGMNPFGWRFAGTLFGVMLIPLMYLFALKVFKKRSYAFVTGFLMTFECMRLAQTRLATIDSYAVFFAVAMYYCMYDYFAVKSYDLKFTRSLKPLLFCGIMFGLGASSKWVCIYTGGGLAIIFFLAKLMEGIDYGTKRAERKEGELPWFVKNFLPTCGLCLLFFVMIPLGIYILSYIPYMASNPDKSLLEIVLDNQDYMFNYHSDLDATHPYGSQWWSWPVIGRPIWYYIGPDLGDGMRSTIVSLGNPLIWWVGIPCAIGSGYFAWRNKDKSMIIFYVALVLQYAPWILIDRVCFIYHFFTSVPFLIFMIVYFFKNLIEKQIIPKYVLWIYMGLVAVVFLLYYPVLTGLPVPTGYVEKLRLFSSWYF